MRDLVQRYLSSDLSRRGFVQSMVTLGFTAAAAESVLAPLEASEGPSGSARSSPEKVTGSGGDVVVAQMEAAGVEYLFTNPGSFEVGLFDSFVDRPNMQLIMGLHEGIVIAMADGYHRMSGKPAFVNLHVIAGTAQAAGQMFNASRDGSALIVSAGLNDNEMWSDDAVLAPQPGFDQKDINRQFTKISWEAREPRSLALMLRRAFKVATTEPGGPVYLAMAHHALEAKQISANILPAKRFMHRNRMRPAVSAVEDAAKLFVEARNPVLVVGDEVWKSGAQADVVRFAEKLGLPVTSARQAFQNFPARHPQYLGGFRMDRPFVKDGADLLLVAGARDFGGKVVPDEPEAPLAAKFVRMGIHTGHMGRNYPTDVALRGDVKEGLNDLSDAIDSLVTKDRLQKAAEPRAAMLKAHTEVTFKQAVEAAHENFGRGPIHPDELGWRMAQTLPKDSVVVAESLTGKHGFFNFGHGEDEPMWLFNTGYGLGWGIGAATGAKLAAPDRPVVCSIGDGALMYSASGLWSQARYGVPVLTVVWNNQNYQTVRHAYERYKGKMADSGHYVGMYLGDPDINFAQLAESQGVSGETVTSPDQIEPALKRGMKATADGKPYLIDVRVARYGGGAESEWHQRFSLADRRTRKV